MCDPSTSYGPPVAKICEQISLMSKSNVNDFKGFVYYIAYIST